MTFARPYYLLSLHSLFRRKVQWRRTSWLRPICLGGKDHIVCVDRFSGYLWTSPLRRTGTDNVTSFLTSIFETFGFPTTIRTDNGPQFRGPFTKFCESLGIKHEPASPYHPQSNGLAENAVKTCKKLLDKAKLSCTSFSSALAAWRATPRADGASPSFLLLGYQPRLPGLPTLPKQCPALAVAKREQRNSKLYADRGGQRLPLLSINDKVLIQSRDKLGRWDTSGVISAVMPSGDSYVVTLPDGQQIHRGRHFLKLLAN